MTPNAPCAASQWTANCRPSTTSDVCELPSLDRCCKRASARWRGVRSGPLPVLVGEYFSIMETVRVPPKSGILVRCRPGIAGRLGDKVTHRDFEHFVQLTANMSLSGPFYLSTSLLTDSLPILTLSSVLPKNCVNWESFHKKI